MIGCFNKSVILTYLGTALSLFGICSLISTAENEYISQTDIAVICLILAGICDLFDGTIARKCKRNETQKKFGVQIDSLADVVSFLVFPSVLLYFICGKSNPYWALVFAIIAFYVICGINRLAWFNINTEKFDNTYKGLPVTYSALIIPCLYVFLGDSLLKSVLPAAYFVLGVLFVLNIDIPKPRGIFYIIFGILAIALITLIIVF